MESVRRGECIVRVAGEGETAFVGRVISLNFGGEIPLRRVECSDPEFISAFI